MTGIPKPVSLFLRLLLTAVVVGFVVWKLRQERFNLTEIFSVSDPERLLFIFAALALLPLNLGLEAFKWKILIKPFYPEVGLGMAYKAVLAGMASGIFTPNRVGEYAGRVLLLPEGKRVEALVLTFFDRIGQMFITLLMGLTALMIFLGQYKGQLVSAVFGTDGWLVIFIALVFLSLMMVSAILWIPEKTLGWIFSKIKRPWAQKVQNGLHHFDARRMKIVLFIAMLRFFVFSFQYYLLLCAFSYSGSVGLAFGMICLVFLGKSIFPVLGFSELGVREWVAIEVMGIFAVSAAQAFNSTFLLYLINTLLPAAIGAGFLMSLRLSTRGTAPAKEGREIK